MNDFCGKKKTKIFRFPHKEVEYREEVTMERSR